jgi:hypothetical protein
VARPAAHQAGSIAPIVHREMMPYGT